MLVHTSFCVCLAFDQLRVVCVLNHREAHKRRQRCRPATEKKAASGRCLCVAVDLLTDTTCTPYHPLAHLCHIWTLLVSE